ncbi:MAG: adenylate/guanylate cyclase domain-containing protein [Mariprofundaceae bacterium]|nr:adenylate/guanylate cyclase domain-containing protein [Mariprofundaceae bacterium]
MSQEMKILKKKIRFPIRLQWTAFVASVVIAAVSFVFFVIMSIQHDAWLATQSKQAQTQVQRLADELKLHLLSTESGIDIDKLLSDFTNSTPSVQEVQLVDSAEEFRSYRPLEGRSSEEKKVVTLVSHEDKDVVNLKDSLWFASNIVYADTHLGVIAVQYSDAEWESIADDLQSKMFWITASIVLVFSLFVYWMTGRMSRPIEAISEASEKVSAGDYDIQLIVSGNNEVSDATEQFNRMVTELKNRERIRTVFGRYLNPKLIEDVFEGGKFNTDSHHQDVSILFADMVSFTSYSETVSTEQVIRVLNQHFEAFHRIIDHYDGVVDKYIGDAVMAVFNHPKKHKSHERNCALAALAMCEASRQMALPRPDGTTISFRVGINSGKSIVGNIGAAERLEYTLIGNPVNVASRMGGLGAGGEVALHQGMFDALGDDFEFRSIGLQQVKGVKEPLECGVLCMNDALLAEIDHAVKLALQK